MHYATPLHNHHTYYTYYATRRLRSLVTIETRGGVDRDVIEEIGRSRVDGLDRWGFDWSKTPFG